MWVPLDFWDTKTCCYKKKVGIITCVFNMIGTIKESFHSSLFDLQFLGIPDLKVSVRLLGP